MVSRNYNSRAPFISIQEVIHGDEMDFEAETLCTQTPLHTHTVKETHPSFTNAREMADFNQITLHAIKLTDKEEKNPKRYFLLSFCWSMRYHRIQ